MLAARGGVSAPGLACVAMTTAAYHRGDLTSNWGRGPAATPLPGGGGKSPLRLHRLRL